MQYDPKNLAKDLAALAELSQYEVGSDEWIDAGTAILYGIAEMFEPAAPVVQELTLEEKIARRLGERSGASLPSPPVDHVLGEALRPDQIERDLSPANLDANGVQVNAFRAKKEAELEAILASGKEPPYIHPPAPNMAVRAGMASISPALLDPKDGKPWLQPSV